MGSGPVAFTFWLEGEQEVMSLMSCSSTVSWVILIALLAMTGLNECMHLSGCTQVDTPEGHLTGSTLCSLRSAQRQHGGCLGAKCRQRCTRFLSQPKQDVF